MTNYLAYGVDVLNAKMKPDSYDNLYKIIRQNFPSMHEEIIELYRTDIYDHDYSSPCDAFTDYCNCCYENPTTLHNGIESVLCDVINHLWFKDRDIFKHDDYSLHVQATLPKTEADKVDMPTCQLIDAIVNAFIQTFYETELKAEWLEVSIE